MTNKAYYTLNPNDEATDVDNPDQRITEDTKAFTSQSLSFTLGVFDALLTFSLNILILWTISRNLTLSLFGYAAFATSILIISGRKLVKLDYNQLRYEADFRYGLVHIRDNAESIAFYSGEKPEKTETQRRLIEVVNNFNLLIIWRVIIDVMRRSTTYAGVFIPYLIMSAAYFTGEIDFGSFNQSIFAFNIVEGSLFFVVNQIEELAKFTAGISRLEGFQSKVETISKQKPSENKQDFSNISSIIINDVSLSPPDSTKIIVKDLNLSIDVNQSLLVVGPSGCGKTSLLRMISGLWEPALGSIQKPKTGELLFIPQKPYMLLGSLREQLCYPTEVTKFSDEHLVAVLDEVNLSSLIDRYPNLDIKQDWPRILSLGEQQRLAFARLLLNSPRFAVLDEATSALDIATEKRLYNLLRERELSLISVGHRPSLKDFHENILELNGQGNWKLFTSDKYNFKN
jgi:putative ATP-binding cassette transporter